MAKRTAGKQLTDRNWEEEDPHEEAGTFTAASDEKLAKRQIKKAKRRGMDSDSSGSSPAFKGFTGFAGLANKSNINFGEMQFKSVSNGTNTSTASKTAANVSSQPLFKPLTSTIAPEMTTPLMSTDVMKSKPVSEKPSYSSEYCKQLRELNKSVSAWIQKHVATNPLCDLTPIFHDYEKHLRELEKNYPPTSSESEGEKEDLPGKDSKTKAAPTVSHQPEFKFSDSSLGSRSASAASSASVKPTFQFGSAKQESSSDFAKSVLDFKKSTDSSSSFQFGSSTGFKFGGAATGGMAANKPSSGFSFGLKQQPSSTDTEKEGTKDNENEEDQPPKVDFTEVKEADSKYSVRCKLFFKKDDGYSERGVGMMHLKKTGDILQMLIRADTNLGNILLNVGVPSSVPISRQGKNNVLLVSPLNPPVDKKCSKCGKAYNNPQESNVCASGCQAEPVPLLIRVKTSDLADELLNKINELK